MRPPMATLTPTASEAPRRPADFLQPLARRVDQRPMTNQPQVQDQRKLTVGRGIAVAGVLKGCAKLVIEGHVEASLEECQTLEIAEHGSFDGTADVETCEVRGLVEGDLTVRGRLIIRATGRVLGKVRYLDLHIEPGGKLAGQIETLEPASDSRPAEAAAAVAPSPAPTPGPSQSPPSQSPPPPRFTLAQAEPLRPEPLRAAPVLQPLELTEMAEDAPENATLTAERG